MNLRFKVLPQRLGVPSATYKIGFIAILRAPKSFWIFLGLRSFFLGVGSRDLVVSCVIVPRVVVCYWVTALVPYLTFALFCENRFRLSLFEFAAFRILKCYVLLYFYKAYNFYKNAHKHFSFLMLSFIEVHSNFSNLHLPLIIKYNTTRELT